MTVCMLTALLHFRSHTISSNDSYDSKLPTPLSKLSGVGTALRDLAFHEKHAACVDASGNVYQWGDGFSGDASSTDGPVLTLKGKVPWAFSKASTYDLIVFVPRISSSFAFRTPRSTPSARRAAYMLYLREKRIKL